MILQLLILIYPFRFVAIFLSLALGAYLFATTMINDAINDMKSTNDDIKTRKSEIHISDKFAKLIFVHADGKKLSATPKPI